MVNIIGLGDCMVSSTVGDSIKTYALATCIGLVVYNRKDKVLGMVHIVLPEAKDSGESNKKEGFYAVSAVPMIFGKIFGSYPDKRADYSVSLYGGCASKSAKDLFNVGERNVARVEELLNYHNIHYDKSNTGGHDSRTIEAFVSDGSVKVRLQKMAI